MTQRAAGFIVTTVLVSASFWVIGGRTEARLLIPGLPISALMFLAPLIGVVVVCRPAEVWRLLMGVLRRPSREQLRSLARAAAWAPLMPAVVLLSYPLQRLAGTTLPPWQVSWVVAAALFVGFWFSAAAEQVGWTWLLTEELTGRRPDWGVALFVGSLWAVLHLIPWAQAGNSATWIAAQAGFSVVFRFLLTGAFWLVGARLGPVIVLHQSYDLSWALYPVDGSSYNPAYVLALVLIPAMIVWRRRRQGRRAGP